jgi:small subunit ribosomal protein S19e
MAARGRTVKDVPADVFVKTLAEHFKKHEKIKAPSYVDVIKTASFKELPPYDADWFFTRAASIARKVYIRGASVGGLSKIYGGKARRGPRENHYSKASEGINRNILQQLEAAKLIQKRYVRRIDVFDAF